MGNILLVPVRADALALSAPMPVSEPMADFSRLPFFDGSRDVNADKANISEEIVSQPFQDRNLYLKAGVHLHWSLPDALTKGAHEVAGTSFPAVPNRWLVTRSRVQDGGAPVVEKQWVVESDYLYPDGSGEQSGSVTYPFAPDSAKGETRPFRYLGRTVPLEAWKAGADGAKYLSRLTAVGYGEPSFAAFYPNCHSVFGFHDDDYADGPPSGISYDVMGWYADSSSDFLKLFAETHRADYGAENGGAEPTVGELCGMLADECKWSVTAGASFPERMLCYARVTFKPAQLLSLTTTGTAAPAVALADTGTEVLSAYLADEIDAGQKAAIEDQLEAVSFSSKLANRQLDVGPKFVEARHEKGFAVVSSGALWSVTQEAKEAAPADATEPRAESNLPEELAHQLNYLNFVQGQYDHALADLDSMRRQLFADWYKYMVCAYPPDDAKNDYPHADEARGFIERKGLAPLAAASKETGELFLQVDPSGNVTGSNSANSAPGSHAARVSAAVNNVASALYTYNLSPEAQTTAVFRLTNSSLESLKASGGLPDDLLTSLATLKDQKFVGRAEFDAATGKFMTGEQPELYGELIAAAARQTSYMLKQTPAPRYYQPSDPVVLMTGDAVRPTLRHGQDAGADGEGSLACTLFETDSTPEALLPSASGPLLKSVDAVEAESAGKGFGFNVWSGQPWNPFLMVWEAEVFPVESGSNLDPSTGRYSTDFITGNYALAENDVDLSVLEGRGFVTKAANLYSGSCLLSPHASVQMKSQVEAYLQEQILEAYYQAQNVPAGERTEDYFAAHTSDVLGWYKLANCGKGSTDALCNIIAAYELLSDPNFYCLSQALGGFSEALLMRKQTLQLEVADPLAFDDYAQFTKDVHDAVGDSVTIAPAPLSDFNPIRTGALKLLRLRIVDTFGQSRDVDCTRLVTTEKLSVTNSPYPVTLPPRLTQPARLNFRWLSALRDDQEMNDHPATTPVCGWLLPNNLDDSLMVYDNAGRALGSVDEGARWRPAPGPQDPVAVAEIGNPHLRYMVEYLIGRGPAFLQDFISALDNALENIEPENFAQHQDVALLMGRPIALARASVSLEILGRPAIHEGWNSFRQDMQRNARDTNGFEHVRFPVRIGEYRQFNDGLVGYWKETDAGYEGGVFYAPQSDHIKDDHIKTHADDPMTIYQSVNSPPQLLTVLLDPRGSVHATTGVVPVKSVSIPPDQYADALAAIEITFLSAPILTDARKLRMPLPAEPGREWSWLQVEGGQWREITTPGVVKKQDFLAAFSNGETIWGRMLERGWVVRVDDGSALVQSRDKRTQADLGEDLKSQTADVEDLLGRAVIGAVDAGAAFAAGQRLVEGWLKLRASAE